MASSDNLQRCSKCYRYQDTSSFVSKTGRKLKSCKICRDQSSFIYNIQKSSQNNHKTKNQVMIVPTKIMLKQLKKTKYHL